ncbi:hypothetical protein BDZ91DRAFT_740283 [Kalaharituber pfeilii]|nr:hypothetical protein BDZ91DRAFT_740283 [Kalaharituber pfeilii]
MAASTAPRYSLKFNTSGIFVGQVVDTPELKLAGPDLKIWSAEESWVELGMNSRARSFQTKKQKNIGGALAGDIVTKFCEYRQLYILLLAALVSSQRVMA